MLLYGLIGRPLGHSFSKKYFSEKFAHEGITDAVYELYPLEEIEALPELISTTPDLAGLNVTIPYKETVITFLDELDETAAAVGAVNCIRISKEGRLKGYNTDIAGFERSFLSCLERHRLKPEGQACILGTGGAAKAVAYVLMKLNIPSMFVSRNPKKENEIAYNSPTIHHSSFIINCTPVGTFPNVVEMPSLPLDVLKPGILVFDLIYNPAETLLLREAKARGCIVQNGLEMLHLQAEAAWEIWQS